MALFPVKSGTVATIGYEQNRANPEYGTLQVTFKDSEGNAADTYHYYNVHVNSWLGLYHANSKGYYINQYIKGNYLYRRIRAGEEG